METQKKLVHKNAMQLTLPTGLVRDSPVTRVN